MNGATFLRTAILNGRAAALRARRENGRLHLFVENDMLPDGEKAPRAPGMGVGLKNVVERVGARFQDDGHFSSGLVAPGRYRASLDLPWRLA